MNSIVRKATKADLPVLMEFMKGLVDAERPMDPTIKDGEVIYYDLAKIMNSEESDLYVVELNNELVASGYVKIKEDRHYLKHDRLGYLGFMFVPEKHRGKGYNKLIMNTLLKWCKDRNIFEIRLEVYEDNPSAIRAYEKIGMIKHLINMRMNIENMDL